MNRTHEALLIGCALLAIAMLAVIDIVPAAVAQYAPLAALPFILRPRPSCAKRAC